MSNNSIIGCIIHLLEDEFYEIRQCAIKAIKEFSIQNNEFKNSSKDILLYMLNDENDHVRIFSIKTL